MEVVVVSLNDSCFFRIEAELFTAAGSPVHVNDPQQNHAQRVEHAVPEEGVGVAELAVFLQVRKRGRILVDDAVVAGPT